MLVVFPYSLKDQKLAVNLAAWIRELAGGTTAAIGHNFLIVVDSRVDGLVRAEVFARLKDLGNSNSVEEIVVTDDVDNKWPESPNLMIRKAAKHIEYGTKEPWLWIEPDVVPLKKSWLDEIEAEYKTSGKPFLGDFVHLAEPGFVDHMSGVAVYPGRISHFAGELVMAHSIAWDCYAAGQIIPQMHKSKLILHRWKYPAFDSWEQVEQRIFAVNPDCVLFHSDKKMSLVPLLRQQKNLPVPVLVEPKDDCAKSSLSGMQAPGSIGGEVRESTRGGIELNSRSGQFICDIFIKSFPGDYEWLGYCLRSIEKFASGFRKIVLILPAETRPGISQPSWYGLREQPEIIEVQEPANGYLFQQVCKLNADKYTDADFVLFMDSDCILTCPVTPETFIRDGKIMWLMTPMDKAREDQRAAWLPVMTKWMNKVPEYEFMNRHPFIFPRWFFEKIRGFCANQHGTTLDDYIMSQPGRSFSEFNCAGFFTHEHFRDRFEWINTETDQVPPVTVLQNWSPGGLTEEIKAELEAILSAGPPSESFTTSNSPIIPNSSGDTSRESIVRDAVSVLKQLCTAPRYISQVRKELKAQGVTR